MTAFHSVLRLNSSLVGNYRSQFITRISTSPVFNYTPKQTIEEKLGILPRPRRPISPYVKYLVQIRPSVLQENPNAKPQEIVRLISERWKNADPKLKESMLLEYHKEREKFMEELKHYEEILSPDEKEEVAKAKESIKTEKEKRALKKKKEELGCPKKPGSSYILFLRSKLPERRDSPYNEFVKKIREEWESLPAVEKSKYENIYKEDLEAYRVKMNLWGTQMREKGLGYLVPEPPKMAKPRDTPKKPGAAYSYYQKFRISQRGNIPVTEFQKQIAEEWEKMSEKEREKYEQIRRKDLEDYDTKMEAWSKSRRESKSKAGEIPENVSTPEEDSHKHEVIQTETSKKEDLNETPLPPIDQPTDQKVVKNALSPEPMKTWRFTSKKIIMTSICISITFVFVFSVYIIVFY